MLYEDVVSSVGSRGYVRVLWPAVGASIAVYHNGLGESVSTPVVELNSILIVLAQICAY